MNVIDLSGKVAVVTGGGQGLGLATATALHAAGASVVLNYFEDSSGTNQQRAVAAAEQLGEHAIALPADVRNRTAVEAMLDEVIQKFQRLDLIINNAAIIRDRTIRKMTDDEWEDVIQ